MLFIQYPLATLLFYHFHYSFSILDVINSVNSSAIFNFLNKREIYSLMIITTELTKYLCQTLISK